jgi:DNA-binding IclR family transcriptional regulator
MDYTPPEDVNALRELVSHRYLVEILDLISRDPRGVDDLAAAVPAARTSVPHVLRVLAAHRLVATEGEGSWDDIPPGAHKIGLTALGRQTVEALSSIDVWTALYNPTRTNPP